jgi:hypothetical protein
MQKNKGARRLLEDMKEQNAYMIEALLNQKKRIEEEQQLYDGLQEFLASAGRLVT